VGGLGSLPVLRSRSAERNFRAYLQNDPRSQLQHDDVWLGAQSQPITDQQQWTWVGAAASASM